MKCYLNHFIIMKQTTFIPNIREVSKSTNNIIFWGSRSLWLGKHGFLSLEYFLSPLSSLTCQLQSATKSYRYIHLPKIASFHSHRCLDHLLCNPSTFDISCGYWHIYPLDSMDFPVRSITKQQITSHSFWNSRVGHNYNIMLLSSLAYCQIFCILLLLAFVM